MNKEPHRNADQIQILKERIAVYESSPETRKGSLGLSLRKLYAAITGGQKPN